MPVSYRAGDDFDSLSEGTWGRYCAVHWCVCNHIFQMANLVVLKNLEIKLKYVFSGNSTNFIKAGMNITDLQGVRDKHLHMQSCKLQFTKKFILL